MSASCRKSMSWMKIQATPAAIYTMRPEISLRPRMSKTTPRSLSTMPSIGCVKTTDPLNGVTRRTYDDRGNLIAIENPNNGITYYEYDRNNRLTKTIRPMLQETDLRVRCSRQPHGGL